MPDTQYGLFEGPENVKTRDLKLEKEAHVKRVFNQFERAPKRNIVEIRISALRGFIELYSDIPPQKLVRLPLECLGGKTLENLCVDHYGIVEGWKKEFRLRPQDRKNLIKPSKGKNG